MIATKAVPAPVQGVAPREDAVPVEGCMTCAALARSRELAREACVPQAVASANREIGNHPHQSVKPGGALPIATVWGVIR